MHGPSSQRGSPALLLTGFLAALCILWLGTAPAGSAAPRAFDSSPAGDPGLQERSALASPARAPFLQTSGGASAATLPSPDPASVSSLALAGHPVVHADPSSSTTPRAGAPDTLVRWRLGHSTATALP